MTDLPAPPTFKATLIRLGVALVLIGALIVATINYSTYTPPASSATADKQASSKATKKPSAKKASSSKAASSSNASASLAAAATDEQITAAAIERASQLSPEPTTPRLSDVEVLSGSRFTQTPVDRNAAPAITSIALPRTKDSYAIWGALGTDDKGQIWTAISTDGRGGSSAQLVSYDPATGDKGKAISRGMVLDELKKLGLYQPNMGQSKIHSRIIQGADGYLYFASLDEQGEAEDASANPTWGSWMWRMRAPDYKWEPLFHAPQGLIAVAGFGTDIYALGYHNHVLYHFDTLTGKHTHIEVGSVQGHISRNILVDNLGNVFVPRLTAGLTPTDPPTVELVQFDRDLKQIHATKIDHYLTDKPRDSHGIISSVTLKQGVIVFATHKGFLYEIAGASRHGMPSVVEPMGYFHPRGSRYTSTMHTYDGGRFLVGVVKAYKPAKGQPAFEWIVYDRILNESTAVGLDIKPPPRQSVQNLLLYGSMTRDLQGNFYIVGTHLNARLPLLIKLTPKAN